MEPIKPVFSEANKFAVLKIGFKDEFDKAYNNFWKSRNMKAPDTSWFGEKKNGKKKVKL